MVEKGISTIATLSSEEIQFSNISKILFEEIPRLKGKIVEVQK